MLQNIVADYEHLAPAGRGKIARKPERETEGTMEFMKAVTAALLVLTVTAAEAANTKRTTSALDGYTRCLSQTAARLDDGKTDPKTVAVGVAIQCAWKRELAIAEMMKGSDDPDAKQGAAEAVRGAETEIIVGMVLELRKVAT
jgi:hypothetical protein